MLRVFFLISCLFTLCTVQAQEAKTADAPTSKWSKSGALGLDLAQLTYLNPRVGAGENRIGILGKSSFIVKYLNARHSWDNNLALNFGVQRLGRGQDLPFQKSVDELRLSSTYNYALSKDSPFGFGASFQFTSQLTPTYSGNLLSSEDGANRLISKFLAPANLVFSPGFIYKPSGKWGSITILGSPLSFKSTIVYDDSLAVLGVHGNPTLSAIDAQDFIDEWNFKPKKSVGDVFYSNIFNQLGATLKVSYSHAFWKYKEGDKDKNRVAIASTLMLYSNYLRNFQNVDVEWRTNIDMFLFKGLSLSVSTDILYDDDVLVLIDADNDIATGVNGYESTGKRVSLINTVLLKYTFLF